MPAPESRRATDPNKADPPTVPLDIEVDGIHHTDSRGRQRRQDLARDQILESMGWRVLRIPAWQCLSEPDRAAAAVDRAAGSGTPGADNGAVTSPNP